MTPHKNINVYTKKWITLEMETSWVNTRFFSNCINDFKRLLTAEK